MNKIKLFAIGALLLLTTGCANQAAQDYYIAMQASAAANASQQEARYRALATVASQGDENAAIAATMAIAMTQDKVITPQYVESEALSWTRVLAAPVAAVAGLYIQADVSKHNSDNMKDIQIQSYQSNEAIQLGQQSNQTATILGLSGDFAQAGAGSTSAIAGLGIAGFNALNESSQQGYTTVDSVAGQGFDASTTLGIAGIGATSTVGQAGMAGIESTAQMGFNAVENVIGEYNQVLIDNNTTLETLFPLVGQTTPSF